MAKTTVEFDFSIGEPVLIRAIGMNGRIDGLSTDNQGPMYRVVYWNDGNRNSIWMYPWEIQSTNGGQ